ncbi:MAG TPA: DMT family transporter [Bellilinea sp.]|nr:DMT family transporter [Bellilinea sp.]
MSTLLTSIWGGVVAALMAALFWAYASLLFDRMGQSLSALEINLIKGSGALFFSLVTLLIGGETLAGIPLSALLLLSISGVIGITFGDTTFLQAIRYMGARRMLLLSTLAPPITGLISWVFLGERLPALAWLGILVTIAGIAWVITERTAEGEKPVDLRKGLFYGILAALGQSIALVISRAVLTQNEISSLQSSIVRLIPSMVLLVLWQLARKQPPLRISQFKITPGLWKTVLIATIIGAYLAMWLQQIAVGLAPAGIAQTLLSTSPVFVLPMAALNGEKLSWRAVLGAVIALAGVWVLIQATSMAA